MDDTLALFFAPQDAAQPGRKLAYYSYGDSSNPNKLLCVHGLSRNGRDFDFLAKALSSHYHIISVDVAGRGKSDWLSDVSRYNYTTYFADISALLAHLNIIRCAWVGTSMGGILGMMTAALNPTLITRMVLNDVGTIVPRQGLTRITQYVGKNPLISSEHEAMDLLRYIFKPFGIHEESHWQHMLRHSFMHTPEGMRFAYDPQIITPFRLESDNFTNIKDVDLTAFWEKVTCPVLVLRGETSDILTAEITSQMLQKQGVSELVFNNVGHAPALLDDGQINAVKNWICAG